MWQDDAACRLHNPEMWFPHGSTSRKVDVYAEARAICLGCPVLADCLRYVLTTREDDGMWAALTPEQRADLYRERPVKRSDPATLGLVPADKRWSDVAACGTPAGYQRHRNRGEATCRACRDSVNDYNRAKKARAS